MTANGLIKCSASTSHPAREAELQVQRQGDSANTTAEPRLIAFYLPQFHPIPENDNAWGRGFTEWTNVAKAKPLYKGHHQPQLPTELGYYDLRLPETIRAQADLAREYGVYGFCFYYYWFDGRRVLERPLEVLLENPDIDLPFCLCWANENWTRRWDGAEHEVIIAQHYDPEKRVDFIPDIKRYILDPRYIRVDGKPLLLVYRPNLIPNLRETLELWRASARELGEELHIVSCLTFGFDEPLHHGFDAAAEFPPHGVQARKLNDEIEWEQPFHGAAYSYDDVVRHEISKVEPPFTLYRTAMAGWDNTARRGSQGNLFFGATPETFETWLTFLVLRCRYQPVGEQIVFINAWNEWAEGAHLEPDNKFGRKWLAACSRAMTATTVPFDMNIAQQIEDDFTRYCDALADAPESRSAKLLLRSSLADQRAAKNVAQLLARDFENHLTTHRFSRARAVARLEQLVGEIDEGPSTCPGWIDLPSSAGDPYLIRRELPFYVVGWLFPPEYLGRNLRCVVSLTRTLSEESFAALVGYGYGRDDVALAYPDRPFEQSAKSGFEGLIDVRELDAGIYHLRVGLTDGKRLGFAGHSLEVLVA